MEENNTETAQKNTQTQQQSTPTAQKEHKNTEHAQAASFTSLTKIRVSKKKALMIQLAQKHKGANLGERCRMVGISRQTHYNWLHKDEHYKSRMDEASEDFVDTLEATAYTLALEKNPQVLLATLKAKAKDRGWGDDPKALVQLNQGFQLNIVAPEEKKEKKEAVKS
jgi:hypothetical protein